MAGNLKKHYDTVVVGSGIAGILLTQKLTARGESVLLLEGSSHLGGRLHQAQIDEELIDHRLRHIPADDFYNNCLSQFASLSGQHIDVTAVDNKPLTYDGLKPIPYMGFGDKAPAYYETLQDYLSPQRLTSDFSYQAWIESSSQNFDFRIRAQVTEIFIDIESENILTINGSKKVRANKIYFTGNPRQLTHLLSGENLPARFFQKLGRQPGWSALGMDFIFDTEAEFPEHLLMPGTKTENHPTVARLSRRGTRVIGQFLTFIEGQAESDGELSGTAVRRVRKQLKKYLPDLFESIVSERVTVSPESHGKIDVKLGPENSVPGIPGLYLAHRRLVGRSHPLADVESAMTCLDGHVEEPRTEDHETSPVMEPAL